jgi:hypothetical protein
LLPICQQVKIARDEAQYLDRLRSSLRAHFIADAFRDLLDRSPADRRQSCQEVSFDDVADLRSVIDFSRFSPALAPRFTFRGMDVVEILEGVCNEVGLPATIRVDQGTEFVSRDLEGRNASMPTGPLQMREKKWRIGADTTTKKAPTGQTASLLGAFTGDVVSSWHLFDFWMTNEGGSQANSSSRRLHCADDCRSNAARDRSRRGHFFDLASFVQLTC